MADLPTELWGGWVVVATLTTLLVMAWLVFDVYFRKDDAAEIAALTWDETLREGTAPAPMWWFWLILALMVTSVAYLILYPGLGRFEGMLHWSQGHEIATSAAHYDERFGALRTEIATTDPSLLRGDAAAMASAQRIFANHCEACHGPGGGGSADLFPNLSDGDWQWGGSAAQVEQTITRGRQAVMPPWRAALADDGVDMLADFVLALSRGEGDAPEVAAGRTRFQQLCSACHGPEGAGNALLGASALDDDVWLYGGSRAAIAASIGEGRSGIMPAFGERLDATQIRLLTAWLTREAAQQEALAGTP